MADAFAFLVFPGLFFAIVAGVLSTLGYRWLSGILGTGKPPDLAAIGPGLLVLWREAAADGRGEGGRLLGPAVAGLGAVGGASSLVWLAALGDGNRPGTNLVALVALLALPGLVAVGVSDWRLRSKGVADARDALSLAYGVILLLTFMVPAAGLGTLQLDRILQYQVALRPLAASLSGGLAFVGGLLAARTVLWLFDGMWEEGAETGNAGQAVVLQILRATWFYAIVGALVHLYWPSAGSGLTIMAAFRLKYGLALLVLVVLAKLLRQPRTGELIAVGWLPLGLALLASLALAAGGL